MIKTKAKILIVDDEEAMCELLNVILSKDGYQVTATTDGLEALKSFRKSSFDVIIQDIKMPEIDGITLMQKFKEIDPLVAVIIITAFSTDQIAVETMRYGAYDYIKKPFDNNRDVRDTVARALRYKEVLTGINVDQVTFDSPLRMIVGATPQIKEMHDIIRRVSATDSTVLIHGESGTGKELVARAIHYHSARSGDPFITVNCGAFAENLLESELFGHLKGSFTSAASDKKGLLAVANKGTFFLDEIGELLLPMQVKLLRVMEEKEFKPVGSTETKKADVRFIVATNADLQARVQTGNFREDLYYRLNVVAIKLPTLRERKGDIPLLAGYFLAKYSKIMKKNITGFADSALQMLLTHHWPGNVRELENTVQRAVALTEETEIQPSDFAVNLKPFVMSGRGVIAEIKSEMVKGGFNLPEKVKEMEVEHITRALQMTHGQLTKAAQLLNMSFRALRYKIKKYGINKGKGG